MKTPANRFAQICVLALGSCAVFAGCQGTPTNFNAVQLTPSAAQTIDQGQTVNIGAKVLNDTSGAGVTWTVSGGGTLSGTTTSAATYNAPSPVSTAFTATVTATSVTFPTKSASLAITVEPGPAITTTSLPAAGINVAYSATVSETGGVGPYAWSVVSGPAWLTASASTSTSVTLAGTPGSTDAGTFPVTVQVTDAKGLSATSSGLTVTVTSLAITTTSPLPTGVVGTAYSVQFAATGGTAPYTWSLASGSSLPAGLTLNASGLLSGTPTAAVSNATFGITLTDSESPAVSVTVTFTLTISSTSGGTLNGNYAFEFSGFNAKGAVVGAGSFTADGQGNIKNGVEDVNTIGSGPATYTFTGTYTIGVDGRGQLLFNTPAGSSTYAFAIDANGHGRLIEFDASGTQVSGQLELQTVSTCAFNTISGEYVFGASGYAAGLDGFSAGPVVMAGRFTATPPGTASGQGSLGNGEMDANTPGRGPVQQPVNSVSGTYQTTTQAARCSATVTPSTLPNMAFNVYPVSGSEAFLVGMDNASVSTSTTPFVTVGTLRQQVGYPFTTSPSGAFSGASVGGMVGQFTSGTTYVPDVAVVSIDATGGANFNLLVTENRAGTVTPFNGAGQFVQADSFGRVATQGLNQEIDPVFYTIDGNEAFCLGEVINNPFFGIFEPQSTGPFTAATIQGSFVEGTAVPAISGVPNLAGIVTLDGTSGVSGNEAEGTSASLSILGTYALTATGSTDGSGTLTLTSPAAFTGSFFIVSPTEVVMVSTTSGDANPVLIVLGHP